MCIRSNQVVSIKFWQLKFPQNALSEVKCCYALDSRIEGKRKGNEKLEYWLIYLKLLHSANNIYNHTIAYIDVNEIVIVT